jgi:adenylate cyclase
MSFTYGIASNASQDRLEKLIEKRLKSGGGKSRVDEQIWNLFGERWAVMFTDLSGFSRHVADFGIIHFLQTVYESNRLLVPIIEEYSGILLKVEGDSLLVIFRSVDEAIECAVAMQRCTKKYNRKRSANEQVLLCIGLGFGDVLRIGDSDVFGAEVNAASKLGEDTAKAYDILVTGSIKRAATKTKDFSFKALKAAPPGADSAYRLRYDLNQPERLKAKPAGNPITA